jgi:hypothetical protein
MLLITKINLTIMKIKSIIMITGFLVLTLISCNTTQTSMIVADNYDIKQNQTTLTLLPYGNIVFPNKWNKTSYNNVSKQHFFTNNDSTTIAVAKSPREKYPFYKSSQTDKEFVSEFVKWDAEYWKNQGLTVKTISDKSDNGFIVWQVTDEKKKKVNTIFIFGSKNNFAYNFSGTSQKWTDDNIQQFLTKLYTDN